MEPEQRGRGNDGSFAALVVLVEVVTEVNDIVVTFLPRCIAVGIEVAPS